MRGLRPTMIAVLALAMLTPATSWAGFTQIVLFGDSLSDVGNTFTAIGYPPAPYFQGHYSNGNIWLEYLVPRLGVSTPTASLLGGTDYAWGGAESGPGFSPRKEGCRMSARRSRPTSRATPRPLVSSSPSWPAATMSSMASPSSVTVNNISVAITTLAAAGGRLSWCLTSLNWA